MKYEDMSIQELQKEICAIQTVLYRKLLGNPADSVVVRLDCVGIAGGKASIEAITTNDHNP